MLNIQDFIAAVETIIRNENEKARDDKSNREDWRQTFVESSYSTGAGRVL